LNALIREYKAVSETSLGAHKASYFYAYFLGRRCILLGRPGMSAIVEVPIGSSLKGIRERWIGYSHNNRNAA